MSDQNTTEAIVVAPGKDAQPNSDPLNKMYPSMVDKQAPTSEVSALSKMYPSMVDKAAEAIPEQKPVEVAETDKSSEAIAEKLYRKDTPEIDVSVPDAVKALRESQQTLHDATAPFTSIDIESLLEDIDIPDEAKGVISTEDLEGIKKAVSNEYRKMLADVSATPQEATQLVNLFKQAGSNPPDETQRNEWVQTAQQRIDEAYGQDSKSALAMAKKLAQRDPRMLTMLEDTGLGDHPDVVLLFAQWARQESMAGRL